MQQIMKLYLTVFLYGKTITLPDTRRFRDTVVHVFVGSSRDESDNSTVPTSSWCLKSDDLKPSQAIKQYLFLKKSFTIKLQNLKTIT